MSDHIYINATTNELLVQLRRWLFHIGEQELAAERDGVLVETAIREMLKKYNAVGIPPASKSFEITEPRGPK